MLILAFYCVPLRLALLTTSVLTYTIITTIISLE
jgi:hypothetical protein